MENFDKRLTYLFDKFSLNASTFADKIGVQRSSLSHILSGRNKPSLDFILKIYETFPEINLAWLALGEGDFSKLSASTSLPNTYIAESIKNENHIEKDTSIIKDIAAEETKPETLIQNENHTENRKSETNETVTNKIPHPLLDNDSEIDQILFFYKDGTFKSYRPK